MWAYTLISHRHYPRSQLLWACSAWTSTVLTSDWQPRKSLLIITMHTQYIFYWEVNPLFLYVVLPVLMHTSSHQHKVNTAQKGCIDFTKSCWRWSTLLPRCSCPFLIIKGEEPMNYTFHSSSSPWMTFINGFPKSFASKKCTNHFIF